MQILMQQIFMFFQEMDRSWINCKVKMTPEYIQGVKTFMDFVLLHNNGAPDMVCPCRKCANVSRPTVVDVRCHIHINGMSNCYTTWIYHGESSGSNNESPDETVESDDFELFNASHHDNVGGLLEDLVYESGNFPFFFVFSFGWVHPGCLYQIL